MRHFLERDFLSLNISLENHAPKNALIYIIEQLNYLLNSPTPTTLTLLVGCFASTTFRLKSFSFVDAI